MRWAFVALIAVHALIHLMGFAKAFEFAAFPQLTQPISRLMGLVWLLAAVLTLASVVAVFAWPRWWWALGGAALLVSQVVVLTSWRDARFGTGANLIFLVGVLVGFLTQGPTSLRARYEDDAERGLARVRALPAAAVITEADLAPLPPPVQRYLRAAGFVGQPRTLSYRLRFRGRLRGAPSERWMEFAADQQSFADQPTRLFVITATMFGLPVHVFHRFVGPDATFQVKLAGAITMVDARGSDMDRAETVTLFNDMCILAPGTLLSPNIAWEPIDDRTTRARFTNGAHTISATLYFDDKGRLTDFVSDDRLRSSRDGTSFVRQRWSTPVRDYRAYGPIRLASHGEARWHAPEPEGEFVYGEFDLLAISYDVR